MGVDVNVASRTLRSELFLKLIFSRLRRRLLDQHSFVDPWMDPWGLTCLVDYQQVREAYCEILEQQRSWVSEMEVRAKGEGRRLILRVGGHVGLYLPLEVGA